MKHQIFLIFFSFFCSTIIFGQFKDDFSDANLSQNPTWVGDTTRFVVNKNLQLQLNALDAGTSTIYAPIEISDSTTWNFWVRMDFAPSASNQTRVFLQADKSDFTQANGYFMDMGENGSADALRLFRQDGKGKTQLLATATVGAIANEPVVVRAQVTRSRVGEWRIFADYKGEKNLKLEASATDKIYAGSPNLYFGIVCTYTATRKDKFFFDDFSIFSPKDTEPPKLTFVRNAAPNQLAVFFSKNLDKNMAENIANYSIEPPFATPVSAVLVDKNIVSLTFDKAFPSGNFTLNVRNITDIFGNINPQNSYTFAYTSPKIAAPYDVIFTEIMADPTPVIGLPETEFIELFNRSKEALNLKKWHIKRDQDTLNLPEIILAPQQFLVIYPRKSGVDFTSFGASLPLDKWLTLNNEGAILSLYSSDNQLIDVFSYSKEMYNDAQKSEGGWSLERITTKNPCLNNENWQASENLLGGTPGQQNSIAKNEILEQKKFDLVRIFPKNETTITLYFNQKMDENMASNLSKYTLTPNIIIEKITQIAPDIIELNLKNPLQKGTFYTLELAQNFVNCIGNPINIRRKNIVLPQEIETKDVVINEILFNPKTGGFDFVELYNRSDKIIDIATLNIANIQDKKVAIKPISTPFLLFPKQFVVLTENPDDILARYTVENDTVLLKNDLPNFNDDMGNVTIYSKTNNITTIIDALNYDEKWHYPLLDDVEGISLERIEPDAPTQNQTNWTSSAQQATPTAQNSQYLASKPGVLENDGFTLSKKVFSPDGDGYDDVLNIFYNFDKNGFTAKVSIFDANGVLVRDLVKNELLGVSGHLRWDGLTDENVVASMGIYVVFISLFTPDGETRYLKKTCVVAKKL